MDEWPSLRASARRRASGSLGGTDEEARKLSVELGIRGPEAGGIDDVLNEVGGFAAGGCDAGVGDGREESWK